MSYPDEVFEPANKPFSPERILTPIPARIVRGLKNEQIRENDFIVLKALFAGNPTPRVSWYKNNMPIVMSERHSTHVEESKNLCALKIKNAKNVQSSISTSYY